MDDLLSTVEVGRIAGVGPTAVKRWADQGLIPCVRTAGGHRRFPRQGVERFIQASRGTSAASFVDLLIQTDGLGVEARLLVERSRLGSWLAVTSMLGQALVIVGDRWRAGDLTILQEHMASERLVRALARIVEAMPLAPGAPRCVLACAEGERHSLGLSLVEVALREAGWATPWAGNDTPAAELADLARSGEAEMIALSASAASTRREDLERQADVVGRACAEAGVALVLGGSGDWPDPPPHGLRLRDVGALVAHAHVLAADRDQG